MGNTLDFVITPRDWNQILSCRTNRLLLIVSRSLGALLLAYAFWHLFSAGFGWPFVLLLLMAFLFGMPFLASRLVVSSVLAITRPAVHVTIDECRLLMTTDKSRQDLPWSSLADHGAAEEYRDLFWLECSRGTIWIPKRAFATESEKQKFRSFVASKMGDRCKFESCRD